MSVHVNVCFPVHNRKRHRSALISGFLAHDSFDVRHDLLSMKTESLMVGNNYEYTPSDFISSFFNALMSPLFLRYPFICLGTDAT
jgi:hypothetical protein